MQNQGKSVGAIVRDERGRFLALYRLVTSKGLAFPAGHPKEDESPEECLRREVLEETGLRVLASKEVCHQFFPNLCGKGHDGHEWWVYEVEVEGEPELKEPDKHRFLKFMSLEEMRPYIESGEYDPAWFDHIFPALPRHFWRTAKPTRFPKIGHEQ